MENRSVSCPISRKQCKLCVVYRGRHYYALPACKEYLLSLRRAAVRKPQSDRKDVDRNGNESIESVL